MELTERLYVSDVDGTLFENGEPKISEEGAELFRKLVKRGIAFTIASGRNLYGVYDLAQECGITLPVIAYNGSAIYDFQKGKMLRYFAMEQTAVARLCGLFDGANLPFKACVYFKNQERCLTFNQNGYRSSLWTDRAVHPKSGLLYDEPTVGKGVLEILSGECLYVGTSGKREVLEPLYQRIEKLPNIQPVFHQSPYDSEKWFIDVGAEQAGKGTAALALKEMIGAKELIVYGDNHNDIPMLKAADRAYVVSSASPEVAAYADAKLPQRKDSVLKSVWEENQED